MIEHTELYAILKDSDRFMVMTCVLTYFGIPALLGAIVGFILGSWRK